MVRLSDGVMTVEGDTLLFSPAAGIGDTSALASSGWRKRSTQWVAPREPIYAQRLRRLLPCVEYGESFLCWVEQLGDGGSNFLSVITPGSQTKRSE